MKKLILDLSGLNSVARRDVHNSIQSLLFAMGFLWLHANGRQVRNTHANALVVNPDDIELHPDNRKWNHIGMREQFASAEHEQERGRGSQVFNATSPNDVAAFLFSASELIREKHETIMESTIGGVHVEIGPRGSILDFSELLEEVQTEALRQWRKNYEMAR